MKVFEIDELEDNWNDTKGKTFQYLIKKHNLKGNENELLEVLSNHELNTCDFCEEIESTYDLNWIDGLTTKELKQQGFNLKKVDKEIKKGNVACCSYCESKLKESD